MACEAIFLRCFKKQVISEERKSSSWWWMSCQRHGQSRFQSSLCNLLQYCYNLLNKILQHTSTLCINTIFNLLKYSKEPMWMDNYLCKTSIRIHVGIWSDGWVVSMYGSSDLCIRNIVCGYPLSLWLNHHWFLFWAKSLNVNHKTRAEVSTDALKLFFFQNRVNLLPVISLMYTMKSLFYSPCLDLLYPLDTDY